MILVAAAIVIGATFAFFSDTETSTGNTFVAGALDLKVDSTAHYNGLICRNIGTSAPDYRWLEPVGTVDPLLSQLQALDHYNTTCDGTWTETDLGATNQFFQLVDVKPGDEGENTISLHVYDNDAWGRFLINNVQDLDNTCTEPELEDETDCVTEGTPGELAQSITFKAWLDQGITPGFQNIGANGQPTNTPDQGEGDNLQDCEGSVETEDCNEPLVILPGTVDNDGGNPNPDETHSIWSALSLVYDAFCSASPINGANNYGPCQGIADDGRLVGSTTYYFGLAWSIPDGVGNEAQTDSLNADLTFEAVQHRNNPSMDF